MYLKKGPPSYTHTHKKPHSLPSPIKIALVNVQLAGGFAFLGRDITNWSHLGLLFYRLSRATVLSHVPFANPRLDTFALSDPMGRMQVLLFLAGWRKG